jgi:hypothetical protein
LCARDSLLAPGATLEGLANAGNCHAPAGMSGLEQADTTLLEGKASPDIWR